MKIVTIVIAILLFVSAIGSREGVRAADDVTLPESIQVTGLVLGGQDGLENIQRSDTFLLESLLFGTTMPIVVAGDTIVQTQSVIVKDSESISAETESEAIPTLTTAPTATPVSPTSTPTESPVATPQPTNTPVPQQSSGLNADKLFDMANNHRKSIGLKELQKDERACSLAASRAPEISAEISGGYMHAGVRARNLPYWNSENIISMGSEESAFNWWINDQIHKDAIEGDYMYSCVACSGNACVQEFTNFQPK